MRIYRFCKRNHKIFKGKLMSTANFMYSCSIRLIKVKLADSYPAKLLCKDKIKIISVLKLSYNIVKQSGPCILCLTMGSRRRANLNIPSTYQRYTYRVLQTIQMKLFLLCVWAEPAVLSSAKTALKFKYEI